MGTIISRILLIIVQVLFVASCFISIENSNKGNKDTAWNYLIAGCILWIIQAVMIFFG